MNIREKHEFSPKHDTWDLSIGAIKVALKFAAAIIQLNAAKNLSWWVSCSGSLNWSPPKVDMHGLIPPAPSAINASPIAANALKDHS